MTSTAALIFLVVSFPIVIWSAWSDLKSMIIPNKACLALFLVFVILGPFLFTLPDYGFRWLQAVVILFAGFLLTTAGVMGGGDSKLFAAIAPFVALADGPKFLFILCFMSLAAITIHRLLPRVKPIYAMIDHWQSFAERKKFPFGLPLAASLSVYLATIAVV